MACEAAKEGPRYLGGGVDLSNDLLPSIPVFSPTGLSATVSQQPMILLLGCLCQCCTADCLGKRLQACAVRSSEAA